MAIIIGNYSFSGKSVTISNNRIIIDGVDITDNLPDQKKYEIRVEGNIDSIECDVCEKININGEVGSINTHSGDVNCLTVKGSIQTMSGDVDVDGSVHGNIKTMSGDIKHR